METVQERGEAMSSSSEPAEMIKMRLRHKHRINFFLFVLVGGTLVFVAAGTALYHIFQPVTLRIAVGPQGSDDQKLIQALAQTFARDKDSVRLFPVVADGAADSISLLGAHKADLAVARGDLAMPPDAQSVAILRKNVVVLWTPAGRPANRSKKAPSTKINGIAGLSGHRVGVIGRTTANVTLFRTILSESGVAPEKVAIVQFGTDEIAEMARDLSIDAFMAVGPLNSKITTEAISATARTRGEPKFLPIDVSEAIAQKNPLYESDEIPGSTFGSSPARPDEKVETVGVNHLIVAPSSLSETTVGEFTRQLFAARKSLASEIPNALKIETPDTDKDAALPAHRGAAAYIDGTERTFLEKYSDYMWGAILLLSGLGSAGAWFRNYLKRDEKAKSTLLRDRILALIAQARQGGSLEELDRMQFEVDNILRETFDCYDDGAIAGDDLEAFRLVLQQFQIAFVNRRTDLGRHCV